MDKILGSALVSLVCNIMFIAYHFVLGFVSGSWWLLTLGTYYLILSVVRFFVLLSKKNQGFVTKFTGTMLLFLSVPLAGTVILSVVSERGHKFHMIAMIAIAAYTFAKIIVATINLVRSRRSGTAKYKMLRNISFANAFVSVFALQRSMLVSFEGMGTSEIRLFNILTGTAVWIIVLLLGVNLIGGKYIDMSKAKSVKVNKKIAEAVTCGYKKIEKGVVEGYKAIEKSVVAGYTKIEDKFVDAYLTKDGETVQEAKVRMKKEKEE